MNMTAGISVNTRSKDVSMDYANASQNGKDVVISGVKHFDLAQTLDCGQAFRWAACENGYTGIAFGRKLTIIPSNKQLTFKNLTLDEFFATWKGYFDLDRDYAALRERLAEAGGNGMKQALEFSPGLRVMRQDMWETLISFILSQNSNIPRIKKMIEALCHHFGNPVGAGGFAFPLPQDIARLTVDDLAPIRCGYRAAYIIDAARRTVNGEPNIAALTHLPSDEIKRALLQIHGVGPKVAECVLLFGYGRIERFPIDVWIKRVMENLYPTGFPQEIQDLSGIAQQFLFHHARLAGKA